MNIDILHRPTALENLLAGRMRSLGGPDWPAGRRLPMHALEQKIYLRRILISIILVLI